MHIKKNVIVVVLIMVILGIAGIVASQTFKNNENANDTTN